MLQQRHHENGKKNASTLNHSHWNVDHHELHKVYCMNRKSIFTWQKERLFLLLFSSNVWQKKNKEFQWENRKFPCAILSCVFFPLHFCTVVCSMSVNFEIRSKFLYKPTIPELCVCVSSVWRMLKRSYGVCVLLISFPHIATTSLI